MEVRSRHLSQDFRREYPFESHWFELLSGHQIHYVDEGQGPTILLVHGNPTWSFYYRNLIKELRSKFRVIAIDHLGCGFSDKPQEKNLYTLKNHIDRLEEFVDGLEIDDFSLVVHDWGGAIGCGLATRRPNKLKALALHNTAAFTSPHIPLRINMLRNALGEKAIRAFNAFAWPATFMAVTKPLSTSAKEGYLAPYNSYQNRIATARFVQDIPMEKSHPTYSTLLEIERKLPTLTAAKLIQWGMKDFCFNKHFLNRWKIIFSNYELETYPEAGHYLIEDANGPSQRRIRDFFDQHLISATPLEGHYEHC